MKNSRRHTTHTRLALILLAFLMWTVPTNAQILFGGGNNTPTRLIVRAPGGLGVVETLCTLIGGCDLLEPLGDPVSQLFVISTSQPNLVYDLLELLNITHVELDRLITLLPLQTLISAATPPPAGLSDSSQVAFYGSTVWNGYASQPAADIVRASQARGMFNVTGAGIIGVIDTGVDPNHPALAPVLGPGYDFTRNQAGGSETADLSWDAVGVVDGGGSPFPVNGYTIALVPEPFADVINNKQYAAFGHGTMTAGIVHLVAPTASIMPLKAFRADGTGYTSDIIRAVYFGVQNGVRAFNMSFSINNQSTEFENAMDYAASQSVTSAAAAGNNGRNMTVYPAGFQGDVMGVASTSMADTRSSFSNYGSSVWVAAPGEGIVTTYPFGKYAAGWGTSFSAPFVTGTLGLLTDMQGRMNENAASADIGNAQYVGEGMGHGRLDIVRALSAARED